ncbi:hypothetical protein GF348_24210 [candidate division KSB3 bacterium]|nr:hypothetical protein [candidate division KSB3 bacterium]
MTAINQLTPIKPRDIAIRLRAELALRDLPMEEPSPPVHPGWRSYASFCHVNALAAGQRELWAVTWGGVVRWCFENHGSRVTFTRFAGEHGLLGIHFECIALDHYGRPWVGGPGLGLSTFDGERWHTFATDEGLPSNDVLCITTDAEGRLWTGTNRGLGYIDSRGESMHWHNRLLNEANLPADEIRALAVEEGSTLWLGTDWGLYQVCSDGASLRYTTQDGLPCLQVTRLALDSQGCLWIGTAAGLCSLDAGQIVPIAELDQPILSLSAEPGANILWVVTSDGINAYGPEGLQSVESHPALGQDAQGRAVTADGTGQRWFGYTWGVVQQLPSRVLLSRNDVDRMTKGENSLCNCITTIEVDDVGRVWVGTPKGLWYLEHNVWRECQPGIELASPLVNVQAIVFSSDIQGLWVGGWREDGPQRGYSSGLRRFIGTTDVPLVGEMPELPYVDTLTCDTQGRVWIAAGGLIRCFDGKQWERLPSLPDNALGSVGQALSVDGEGVLWYGTTGGLWHHDGEWHREDIDVPVQALLQKGRDLWVGTSFGLKRLSLGQNPCWMEVDDLSNVSINALVNGQDDIVWVGTNRGLARIADKGCRIFTGCDDGLTNHIVQALKLDSNTLWIGTANGLSRFTLEK